MTNTSGFPHTTGAIYDGFTVPDGLVWDVDENGVAKPATVTYSGPDATDLATSLTEAQLAAGSRLASSIVDMPVGGTATFTLTVPLMLDSTVPEGATQSPAEANAGDLGCCTELTSNEDGSYTDTALGIPNAVALIGEDLSYNQIPLEDNVACIPVVVPMPIELRIEKLDAGGRFSAELDPDIDFYLVETRSPENYQLLAQPVRFRLARVDGVATVTIYDQANNLAISAGAGQADIAILQVADVKKCALPVTGGAGPLWWTLVGIGLLVMALIYAVSGEARLRRRSP